ncbi:LysR family transcriptional regulator [Noviherbaspirillum sedimenti]|uniref:LysR family transcriptional regulator n=1 Tax=Noviherbaspirillum sedimenti TaxID=2320865 RepID=A0A3A3G3J2_9BURK|nr:LysR family transcriptional regulator [Noviherbaspirillum sedimenti]RJG03063.1 LysR family transcriptional regulator [Noviherbaspirillum sedimenti]
MTRLDPTSLQLFIAVLEEGTIAAAAEREHIAAAAVSKRISEIESQLRTQLLNRTNKGIEPTAAGIALLGLARRALHELDDISVQMQEYASGMRGHVRIFANISAITQFLPAEIKSFLAEYPQIQVNLEEKISTAVTKAVAENAADIGIFIMQPHGHQLEVFPYHEDKLVLITPADHPLATRKATSFADTLEYDYVGLHTGSTINLQLQNAASELGRLVRFSIQVTSYDALCLMVGSGLGIGILPEGVARTYTKTLRLRTIPLDEPWTRRELKICVRAFDALPVAAKLLVNHLKRQSMEPSSPGKTHD